MAWHTVRGCSLRMCHHAYVAEMSCNQLLLIGYAMYVYAQVQFASSHNIALSLYDMCACGVAEMCGIAECDVQYRF